MMSDVAGLIRSGAEPLAVVRAAVLQQIAGSPRLALATDFVIDDADEIAWAAHFYVWLNRRLGGRLTHGQPHAGVPYALLVELYREEFVEHTWRSKLRLDATGEVVGC